MTGNSIDIQSHEQLDAQFNVGCGLTYTDCSYGLAEASQNLRRFKKPSGEHLQGWHMNLSCIVRQ